MRWWETNCRCLKLKRVSLISFYDRPELHGSVMQGLCRSTNCSLIVISEQSNLTCVWKKWKMDPRSVLNSSANTLILMHHFSIKMFANSPIEFIPFLFVSFLFFLSYRNTKLNYFNFFSWRGETAPIFH